jgi:Rps23 Pro-64 3,4-dihydroxylase Tpa1-like proline 4-hydroxylase
MDVRTDTAFNLIDIEHFLKQESVLTSMFNNCNGTRWLICDNFLKPGIPQRLSADFPSTMQRAGKDPNVVKKHKHVLRKIGVRNTEQMSPLQRDFFKEIQRREFLVILERITGIKPLYADEDLEGGGLHEIYRGGYLNVHTDFNFHPKTSQLRKLNILFYLNENWDEAWCGNLELWNDDVSSMVGSIAPIMNRMAIFETSETSFHGHPLPLQVPESVTRRSLAAYYYTDWPAQLQPRSKTNYRLVPAQIEEMRTRITDYRSKGMSEAMIKEELSLIYQEGAIKSVLKDFPRTEYQEGAIKLAPKDPRRTSALDKIRSIFSRG